MSIVVIGATFVDIKGYPLAKYVPGGRNAGRIVQVHGGVCRNIAEDIANVELRPTFISLVEDSGIGADVLSKLENHKVNTKYIRKVEDGMGTWLAVFDNDNDVTAAISKRPDLSVLADILDEQGDEIFDGADGVVVEIDMDKEVIKRTFALAEKYNVPVYAAVSNISIAVERRDFIKHTSCFVCNEQEAGVFFADDFDEVTPEQMAEILAEKVLAADLNKMVVTMGADGAAYADKDGNYGVCPAKKVTVLDTTGAGDAFIAGVSIGLTHGKTLEQSCEIGASLSASVIATKENVCPRFLPEEFGIASVE